MSVPVNMYWSTPTIAHQEIESWAGVTPLPAKLNTTEEPALTVTLTGQAMQLALPARTTSGSHKLHILLCASL